jgi:hypothetical protein
MPLMPPPAGELRVLHCNIHSWLDMDGEPNPDAVVTVIRENMPGAVSLGRPRGISRSGAADVSGRASNQADRLLHRGARHLPRERGSAGWRIGPPSPADDSVAWSGTALIDAWTAGGQRLSGE